MKKIISIILVVLILSFSILFLTGCTLTVETTDNSVSASVDGDTTEKVDSVIDWIKERISRVFNTDSESDVDISSDSTSEVL